MNYYKFLIIAFLSTVFLTSCDPDDSIQEYVPQGDFDSGVLVLNQGGFLEDNSSISYISFDINTLQNDIFSAINPTITLGDTGQDIGFYNNLAYIVLNVSNKIEIVNRYTMQHVATISTGLSNPRYIAFANGKGFVTNWGDGTNTADDYVAVINLSTNTVSSEIPVVEGPERIIENNGKLYVAHTGGFGYGNSITVLDSTNNLVLNNFPVGDVPNTMQIDNGSLWVACSGNPSNAPIETAGKIVKINLSTNAIEKTLAYSDSKKHISNLNILNSNLYYTVDNGVYKLATSETGLLNTPTFSTATQGIYGIYCMAIKNNHIYIGDAGDYSSNGKVVIYSLGSTQDFPTIGVLQKTHTVGVIPAGFYFNQ